MQKGPARGAWSHSKRDIYIFHLPFREWEMGDSQTPATAGKMQMSSEEKSRRGSEGRAHRRDLKS